MTAFTTNTTSDLPLRKRQMPKAPSQARTAIQRLAEWIAAAWTKPSSDPQHELFRTQHREAGRRAVDNLLR